MSANSWVLMPCCGPQKCHACLALEQLDSKGDFSDQQLQASAFEPLLTFGSESLCLLRRALHQILEIDSVVQLAFFEAVQTVF